MSADARFRGGAESWWQAFCTGQAPERDFKRLLCVFAQSRLNMDFRAGRMRAEIAVFTREHDSIRRTVLGPLAGDRRSKSDASALSPF